jgi:prevent-host-death family protein
MERVMSATDARVHFGELLKAVAEDGDRVIVERAGQQLAAVIPLSEYQELRDRHELAERWERFRKGRERIAAYWAAERAAGRVRDDDFDVTEVIRRGREERSEQLWSNILRGR